MWPNDGSAATVRTTAIAAPPQPFVQPTTQPMAQQLVFKPVAGAAAAADGAETTNTTEGAIVGDTRGREASPPRPSTPSERIAVRAWESKWLRELTVEEGTIHAELDGDAVCARPGQRNMVRSAPQQAPEAGKAQWRLTTATA